MPLYAVISDLARGLDVSSLAALLDRMFRSGELLCFRFRDPLVTCGLFEHLLESPHLTPSVEEISSHLTEDHGQDAFVYGIGPLGAKRWEEVAKPKWDRYIEFERDYEYAPSEFNATMGKFFLKGQRTRLEEGLFLLPNEQFMPGSDVWEHFMPWPATYWKTLEEGDCITFNAQIDPTVRVELTLKEEKWAAFSRWYDFPEEFKQSGYWS